MAKNNKEREIVQVSIDEKVLSLHKNLTATLDEFIDGNNMYGALFINGAWGSGKTYYISNYISKRKQGVSNNSEDKVVYCSVSLNGLSSVQEIRARMFAAIHPKMAGCLDSPITGLVASVFVSVLSYFADASSIKNFDYSKFVEGDIAKAKKVVIFFDDIERCRIDYVELFGYISTFTEMRNCKVVVIGDEEELDYLLSHNKSLDYKLISSIILTGLDDGTANESNISDKIKDISSSIEEISYYDIIKEKYFYKAVNFLFKPDVIFESIVNNEKYSKIRDIII